MEITPASFAQVRDGRDGRRITIEEDVGDIARRVKEISHLLSLQWNEKGEFFAVVETTADGTERLVLTAQECDNRIVERVMRIADASYDFLAEVDAMDARAEREKAHRFSEETGEVGERLAHALRRDIQAKNKVILPKGV
jgi:hypothetical protein